MSAPTTERSATAAAPATTLPSRWRRPAPRRVPDGTNAYLSSTGAMLGLVCLWMVLQMLVLSPLSHHRSQALLYREFRTQLASATAPIGPTVPPGDPVALITAKSIDLDEVVIEGTASGDLLAGPGHKRNTVLPGQVGASVIYGRGATYGAPFGDIADLREGDEIEVVSAQGEKTFTVLGVRREGDPTIPFTSTEVARLTLITAEGDGRLSALTPDETVFVDAEAAEGFPAPSGRPAEVPKSEELMATDTGGRPLLALCLALLTALTLGVIAARQRWSASLVWVMAAPPALALAWATTDVVMRLLPNLI